MDQAAVFLKFPFWKHFWEIRGSATKSWELCRIYHAPHRQICGWKIRQIHQSTQCVRTFREQRTFIFLYIFIVQLSATLQQCFLHKHRVRLVMFHQSLRRTFMSQISMFECPNTITLTDIWSLHCCTRSISHFGHYLHEYIMRKQP